MAFINDITRRKQVEEGSGAGQPETSLNRRPSLEHRTRQTTLLGEMADLLQSCLIADEAYTVIRAFTPKLFPSESGALGVLGASRNLVEVVASGGFAFHRPALRAGPVLGPAARAALSRGRWRLGARLRSPGPVSADELPLRSHDGAWRVVGPPAPARRRLRVGSTPIALPSLCARPRKRLAVTVAERIALALANLRLRDTLRSQSILDPLTGLFNRRYMEETLDLESPAPGARPARHRHHHAGHRSLQAAQRLPRARRRRCVAARAGWLARWPGCAEAISRAATGARSSF